MYGGEGAPDLAVVSDLPRRSPLFDRAAIQVEQAIQLVLEQHGWRAGSRRVGYFRCDGTSPLGSVLWDPHTCVERARAYAKAPSVAAVIGPLNNGCAAVQIPILNEAREGGVALVSPWATFPCFTRRPPGCLPGEPQRYYPTGRRNFARVIGDDAAEAAALAVLAERHGLRRIVVLRDRETHGIVVARGFRAAARALGLRVVGGSSWNPRASDYRPLMRRVARLRPDGIVLAGLVDENGGQVIRDKVAVLGPNRGRVRLLASEGFWSPATIPESSGRAAGMVVVRPLVPPRFLPAAGQAFLARLRERLGVERPAAEVAYAAQAAEVALRAIAASDGTRGDVAAHFFGMRIENGFVGELELDERGDPTEPTFALYRAGAKLRAVGTVTPPGHALEAAAAG